MFDFIKGKISSTHDNYIVLECNSIGYKIYVGTVNHDSLKINSEVTIYTYLHLADSIMDLYGFLSPEEREIFLLLLSVNKIGPKASLNILSYLPVEELIRAIIEQDFEIISKVKGVGQKTAQRITIELKDKISKKSYKSSWSINNNTNIGNMNSDRYNSKFLDSIDVLVSLGYSQSTAEKLVIKVFDKNLSVQEIIKLVLGYHHEFRT